MPESENANAGAPDLASHCASPRLEVPDGIVHFSLGNHRSESACGVLYVSPEPRTLVCMQVCLLALARRVTQCWFDCDLSLLLPEVNDERVGHLADWVSCNEDYTSSIQV